MEPNRRSGSPESILGGRLLAFAGDGDIVGLSQYVTALVYGAAPGDASYDDVLEWVVTTIADVITDKIGPIIDSEVDGVTGYAVTLRTPDGIQLAIDDLPVPERHVWKAIAEVLDGDFPRAHGTLAPVEHGSEPGEQAHALIEAVSWLDRLLDLPALNGPYTVPE
ncbi:hypothetical protein [Rhodococcus sp. O3]|uniref:hypothetical protein n=1 Tax=Rhodococcus sp. O3 TaxID=3404919 RepID=UPI003B66F81D